MAQIMIGPCEGAKPFYVYFFGPGGGFDAGHFQQNGGIHSQRHQAAAQHFTALAKGCGRDRL